MQKLALEKRKTKENFKHLPWNSAMPFVDNSRAVLIHRPRMVSTFNHFKEPYIAIWCYCGISFTGGKEFTFLPSMLGVNKLLCARCEEIAIKNELPSASSLTGNHVHIGKLKAIKVCCDKDK